MSDDKKPSRFFIWLWILMIWFSAAIANYRAEKLAKRVGQLEQQVQRLEGRR